MTKKEVIIQSALHEFGKDTYDNVSMNNISKHAHISKGILYHYFKNKDDLYLSCVLQCVEQLVMALNDVKYDHHDIFLNLDAYYQRRRQFFNNHSDFETIFINAKFNPPLHLKEEVIDVFSSLTEFNNNFFRKHLTTYKLANSLNIEDVVEYFTIFADGLTYQLSQKENVSLDDQEQMFREMVNVILYGIIKGDRT